MVGEWVAKDCAGEKTPKFTMHKRLPLVERQGLLIYLATVAIGLGGQEVTCFKFLPRFDRNPSLVAGLTDDPVDPDREGGDA